ncbi:MAG: T9SS type A sorting domain-containing protein, partial [Flavobacterium sp.]|nr:T9SS type A sorting domain-containing protein [Flavobacterium sp.]
THKHTATDFLVNMDPVYNYNVAKAAIGATMHFSKASTVLNNQNFGTENQLVVFTNSAEKNIYVSTGSLTLNDYNFKVFDITGKVIISTIRNNPKAIEDFSTANMSRGIYLGVIEYDGKQITKKLVIE